MSHRNARPNPPGVSARIIQNSHPAKTAVATAVREKSKLAQAVRCLHHTSKYTAASVRHADAIMDQMMVTQLMESDSFRFGQTEHVGAPLCQLTKP